jgi:alanine transaminase
MMPELLNNENLETTKRLFAADAITRAKKYVQSVPSMGAYTHSQGILAVRKEIADFIQARDRTSDAVDPENIFLTNGASEGVRITMQVASLRSCALSLSLSLSRARAHTHTRTHS